MTYGYEKEVITEVSKLPPHYIAAMPDSVQEEIRQKVIAALTEHGGKRTEKQLTMQQRHDKL